MATHSVVRPTPFERAAPIRPSLFDLPFARRTSPDADAADRHNLEWGQRFGLVTTPHGIAGLEWMAYGLILASCLPGLRGEDLNLAADWTSWIVAFDDQFDGPISGKPHLIAQVMENMIDILRGEPGSPPHTYHPAEKALGDLMARTHARMSPTWCERYFEHQARFMSSVSTEMTQRIAARVWSLDEYMAHRNFTIWVLPLIDLVEMAIGYEMSEVVSDSWECATMRRELSFCIAGYNDVYSLPKDIIRNDPHNAILVLARLHNIPREQAMAKLRHLLDQSLARYLAAQAELPRLFDSLALSNTDREGCLRWSAEMDSLWLGVHDFHLYHPRYSPETMSKAPVEADRLDYWDMLPASKSTTNILSRNPHT
ncbi:terpene synthase family protein [Dyella acidisoli]|uniref:Terpene synthase n=1 Tax=Dyella acidisoli TaxID=1867834 RepID=A0ABQ5XSL6_9GAMM|nr:hypothetical protein [Dyella acidisoli]GLQ94332.1 hypothetical protein GCM10007901_32840 [Dyella acidisoli]